MLEALSIPVGIWLDLPREQKQSSILLITSFPLGVLSVGVGFFSESTSLIAVGLLTLAVGFYALIHGGIVLLKLIVFLLKFLVSGIKYLLRLPFVLLGLLRREMRENVSDLSKGEASMPSESWGLDPKQRMLEKALKEPPPDIPWGWFDFVFCVWVVLAGFQIYMFFGYFFEG